MNFPKIKYPKLMLLLLTFILAYMLLTGKEYLVFREFLISLGYVGTFLSGAMFAYGFTAAFGTSTLLIIAKEQNIIVAGLVAGIGAAIGDFLIFKFLRNSMTDEIKLLSKEKILPKLNGKFSSKIKKYLFPIFGGLIIASPLPDEIGIFLLAASSNISPKTFIIISYSLNTIGIFLILLLGKLF